MTDPKIHHVEGLPPVIETANVRESEYPGRSCFEVGPECDFVDLAYQHPLRRALLAADQSLAWRHEGWHRSMRHAMICEVTEADNITAEWETRWLACQPSHGEMGGE